VVTLGAVFAAGVPLGAVLAAAVVPALPFVVEVVPFVCGAGCVAPLAGVVDLAAPPVELGLECGALPAEPFGGVCVCVCCVAGGGLAGASGEAGGAAGVDALASSIAANGCDVLSWLNVDDCPRGDAANDIAVGKSAAKLGTLGTANPWKRHKTTIPLQWAGHRDVPKIVC
jgi:hypothetical protein